MLRLPYSRAGANTVAPAKGSGGGKLRYRKVCCRMLRRQEADDFFIESIQQLHQKSSGGRMMFVIHLKIGSVAQTAAKKSENDCE